MQTLLLDSVTWDLVLDINGNIAVASEPYALAQDAASAMQLFKGELWYDTTKGVDLWNVLGKAPSLSLLKSELAAAAKTVPGVASARTFISSIADRNVQGQVQIKSDTGQSAAAGFAT